MIDATDPRHPRPAAILLRLVLLSTAAGAAALVLGYLPTRALACAEGLTAMYLGVGFAWIASLAGLVPQTLTFNLGTRARANGMLAGMAVRFLLVLTLLLAGLWSGRVSRMPLALWTAIGYIILLAVDTVALARLGRQAARTPP